MPLLIDGYNLLHASGVLPSGAGPSTLERARSALISFLARTLSDRDRNAAVIVFDAVNAPKGLPDRHSFEGISIRFARGYASADAMIAELIREHTAPKNLVVVSSDHQVQRSAKRRKATAIDSDRWMNEHMKRSRGNEDTLLDDAKPQGPLSPAEVKQWMIEFGEA